MMTMKPTFLHWLGIILILEIGLLHIMTAQTEYDEAAYMGYLFAANFFGSIIAALGIYRKQSWAWWLGLVIAIGSITGYSWSRTVGMPGMATEEWIVPYGVVANIVEVLFVLVFFLRLRALSEPASGFSTFSMSPTILGAVFLIGVSFLTYQWDANVTASYGMHVVSLEQVLEAPEISLARFQDQYGVQVVLVATSMTGSIVDVRLKVLDPQKAAVLIKNQAALLVVDTRQLVIAPHQHTHSRLKKDKIHFIYFSTQHKTIVPGTKVSLVFGLIRVEPVVVK